MTEDELNQLNQEEIFQEFMEQKRMFHFEGLKGIDNLNTIFHALGYHDVYSFLEDNPGAQEALVNFVQDHIYSYPSLREFLEPTS